jgi:radical SAM superfamily enzyme YgiQ (UPF0313 family)
MGKEFERIRRKILSKETGAILKKFGQFKIALGFPNSYEVGISNLGFQTMYRLFNQKKEVICERFFWFEKFEKVLTLESSKDLRQFDVVAFSVPFELDYPNVLQILKNSNIPLKSNERTEDFPILVAGGVALTLNPEVLANFFDLIFIGEAEEIVDDFVDLFFQGNSKEELLLKLAKIKGCYVPKFYQVAYDQNEMIKKITYLSEVSKPQRRISDFKKAESFSKILTPLGHFKSTFLLEVARGCARNCRFCAIGFINKPFRIKSKFEIEKIMEKNFPEAKKKKVGLIGSLISDLPDLEELCSKLYEKDYSIGVSSFRAEKLSPKILEILVKSGLKTLTIAPEVGSERMWKIINKNINREDVLKSAQIAFSSGIQNLKLYFIIGLPFEEKEDIEGIIELVKEVAKIFQKGKRKIILSINPFIPKPFTPFQCAPFCIPEKLKEKMKIITSGVKKIKNIKLEKKSIRESQKQALFSLGNRKVGEVLHYQIVEGIDFNSACQKINLNLKQILFVEKSLTTVFPWEIVEAEIKRDFLISEYQKAQKGTGL